MNKKEMFEDISYALWHTLLNHGLEIINGLILNPLSKSIAASATPGGYTGARRLLTARALTKQSVDGAFQDGPASVGYAKFAIRKGMPGPDQKRMAVENEPHTVDDFDGEIKEGYGKGTKKLLWSGKAVIKIGEEAHIGKVNIHRHDADKAGKHFDFVAEGVEPGTRQFEVNIPAGEFKGRYAFVRPEAFEKGQVLITRMKDRGLVLPKPTFNNKTVDFLKELDAQPADTIVEWKPDGSLANVVIKDNRAFFRSHRETGETYYDRLPAIEWLNNRSRLLTNRILFPGPDQDGTVLKGELFHPEGAARVGGILNSAPDKAQAYQQEHGPVEFYAWDIARLKGRDISGLPYEQRRLVLEQTIGEIRRFNSSWRIVPATRSDFTGFYADIIGDPRGLPFSEGVVVKRGSSTSSDPWHKVKFRDTVDVRVLELLEGAGKREGHVGRMLVETPGGGRGEVGSFKATDQQLKWMWDNRDVLEGQVAEIFAQEITDAGAPRAGVFVRWHPSKSEAGLLMYAMDDRDSMYAMKSAAGWRRK